jgi:hypothetical protein
MTRTASRFCVFPFYASRFLTCVFLQMLALSPVEIDLCSSDDEDHKEEVAQEVEEDTSSEEEEDSSSDEEGGEEEGGEEEEEESDGDIVPPNLADEFEDEEDLFPFNRDDRFFEVEEVKEEKDEKEEAVKDDDEVPDTDFIMAPVGVPDDGEEEKVDDVPTFITIRPRRRGLSEMAATDVNEEAQ